MALDLQWSERWDGTDVEWSESWAEETAPGAFDIDAGTVALAGVVGVAGDVAALTAWEFEPPLAITPMAGVLALTGDVQFFVPNPFDLVAGTVGVAGALTAAGNIAFGLITDFDLVTATLALAGVVAIAGDIESSGSGAADPAAVWAYVLPNGMTAAATLLQVQAQLLDLYRIHGLSVAEPLAVTITTREAGPVQQTIDDTAGTVTVTRL